MRGLGLFVERHDPSISSPCVLVFVEAFGGQAVSSCKHYATTRHASAAALAGLGAQEVRQTFRRSGRLIT